MRTASMANHIRGAARAPLATLRARATRGERSRVRGAWRGHAVAAAGVAAMTLLIQWIGHYARIANISALYLLVILTVAVRQGTGPAIVASLLAFLAFDWCFVEPV